MTAGPSRLPTVPSSGCPVAKPPHNGVTGLSPEPRQERWPKGCPSSSGEAWSLPSVSLATGLSPVNTTSSPLSRHRVEQLTNYPLPLTRALGGPQPLKTGCTRLGSGRAMLSPRGLVGGLCRRRAGVHEGACPSTHPMPVPEVHPARWPRHGPAASPRSPSRQQPPMVSTLPYWTAHVPGSPSWPPLFLLSSVRCQKSSRAAFLGSPK